MRPTCTYCARKHLAQALILLHEAEQGYPEHYWLAVGHLAEASDELLREYPDMAREIRSERKALEIAHGDGKPYQIPIMTLIDKCGELERPNRVHRIMPATSGAVKVSPKWGSVAIGPNENIPPPNVPYDPADYLAPTNEPTTTTTAPKSAGGCGSCDEAKKRKITTEATVARWKQENEAGTVEQRVVIICTLSSFDPSYSLVSVTLDQARAAARCAATTVHVLVHVNANLAQLPPDLPSNIEVSAVLPQVGAADDVLHESLALMLADLIKQWLGHIGPSTVITHDLVFQAGLLNYARAFHLIGRINGYRFFHMIHSSVGARPKAEVAKWRATVPEGHTMIAVNNADLPYLQQYYQAPADRFVSLPNPRDVRGFFGMPAIAAELVTKHALHLATYLQVFPLSGPRMSAKGVTKVIDVFKALLAAEGDDSTAVRLVIADAHANGKPAQDQKTLMKRYAHDIGFPDECLVFVSDHVIATSRGDAQLSAGLDQASVRCLLQLANLFVFPTTSEAGSLVLMEAALAGNLLVLNESLPCLRNYVDAKDALWEPFGSVKEPGLAVDVHVLAGRIEASLLHSRTNQAKQAILHKHCLEAYAQLLVERLGLSAGNPIPERATP